MKKIKWVLILLAALTYIFVDTSPPDFLDVYFLDIGQGDAALIRTVGGVNILIDAGPDNKILYEVARSLPWWDRKIDYVIVSHWHEDHFLGLIGLQDKYRIGQVLVNGHEPQSQNFELWLQSAQEYGLDIKTIAAGQTFVIDEDTRWKILHSASDSGGDYNDTSIVIKFTYDQVDFLFTGDLSAERERLLVDRGADLDSEILKVGHHGSKYSSSQAFLEKVNPKLCVIQSGLDNKFGHPHAETLDRLKNAACQVVNNQDSGRIWVQSDGLKWWLGS